MARRVSMIVQVRTTGFWGSDDDMDQRDEIGEAIDAGLEKRRCGYFDGTDSGGGATNLFFCEIPEAAWDDAMAVALDVLEHHHALDKVVIAKSIVTDQEPDPEIEHAVVWPPNFQGEFDIFRWSGESS
jgi:hypothetical protein